MWQKVKGFLKEVLIVMEMIAEGAMKYELEQIPDEDYGDDVGPM